MSIYDKSQEWSYLGPGRQKTTTIYLKCPSRRVYPFLDSDWHLDRALLVAQRAQKSIRRKKQQAKIGSSRCGHERSERGNHEYRETRPPVGLKICNCDQWPIGEAIWAHAHICSERLIACRAHILAHTNVEAERKTSIAELLRREHMAKGEGHSA